MTAQDLRGLELFAGAGRDDLAGLSDVLAPVSFRPGQVLLRQGEPGRACAVLVAGCVAVTRNGRELAVLGPGSVIGEMAMLTRSPRQATVTARTAVDVLLADVAGFDALLAVPGVRERLALTATRRIAANSVPVEVGLPGAGEVTLRPLVPADRKGIAAVLARQSAESLRRRFFTEIKPSDRLLDFLVDIDYLHHFAWVAAAPGEVPLGVGRYVRIQGQDAAEVAFQVGDAVQGRGLGRLLVGALGPAAQVAGITEFRADVLYDNLPMRALLDRAGATWRHADPGVVAASYTVDAAAALLEPDLRARLRSITADVLGMAVLGVEPAE